MADSIIVATDGSECGGRAVAFAAELSSKLGRDLTIVHVNLHTRPSSEMTHLAESEHLLDHIYGIESLQSLPPVATLGEFFNARRNEVERARVTEVIGAQILEQAKAAAEDAGAKSVRLIHADGDFADEILDAAEAESAGIIVLGHRGLGRVREFVLGSVTQKVLHATDRTVVVVQ